MFVTAAEIRSRKPCARVLSCLLGGFIGLSVCSVSQAVPVASRADLQSLLGPTATLEDFESFTFSSAGSAVGVDCNTGSTLSAASVCNSQGPGLIDPGITLRKSGPDAVFQWNDSDYFGAPSREFLVGPAGSSNGTSTNELVVDFVTAVGAFGVDLRAFIEYPDTARIDIFGADDTTLLQSVTGIALGGDGVPVFFGWADAGGIGRITLSGSAQFWSPIIDNLEFGNLQTQAVPVPPTALLVGPGW